MATQLRCPDRRAMAQVEEADGHDPTIEFFEIKNNSETKLAQEK
jgi:hypothetical protein